MAFQRLRIRRIFRVGACGAVLLLSAASGQAAPKPPETEAQACKTAYTKAQESEQAGRLREAKDLLLKCTKSSCGRLLEQECVARYTRLESDIPTIVLHVIADDKGVPPADALQIRMDGALLTSRLDEPMAVDPGVHEFAIRTADGMIEVSRKVMILEGDVNRPVAMSLVPGGEASQNATEASATRPSDKSLTVEPKQSLSPSGPPAVPFILGGVGLAGVGVGAAFLIVGQQNTWNLAVDSLAVGAGALVGAIWLFARPHSNEKPPPRVAYTIDVHPTASGGMASLSAVF